jgi:HEAT repeat protein
MCMNEDPDGGVRRAAAAALGRLLNGSAFDQAQKQPILAALARVSADASDRDLQRAAAQALRKAESDGDEDDG